MIPLLKSTPTVDKLKNFRNWKATCGSSLWKVHILFNMKLLEAAAKNPQVFEMYLLSLNFSLNKNVIQIHQHPRKAYRPELQEFVNKGLRFGHWRAMGLMKVPLYFFNL